VKQFILIAGLILFCAGCATVSPPKGDVFVKVGTNDHGQTIFIPSDTVDTVVKATDTIAESSPGTPWGLAAGAVSGLLALGVGAYARHLNQRLNKLNTQPKE